MGPYGSKNFKTLLLQIEAKSFQPSPEISSRWSSQKYCFGFFEILSLRFVTIFLEIHHCTLCGNQKPQLSGKRATVV